jgi:hypothetical protein
LGAFALTVLIAVVGLVLVVLTGGRFGLIMLIVGVVLSVVRWLRLRRAG